MGYLFADSDRTLSRLLLVYFPPRSLFVSALIALSRMAINSRMNKSVLRRAQPAFVLPDRRKPYLLLSGLIKLHLLRTSQPPPLARAEDYQGDRTFPTPITQPPKFVHITPSSDHLSSGWDALVCCDRIVLLMMLLLPITKRSLLGQRVR